MVKKKKETIEFKKDEGPRPGTTVETLAKLRTINPGGFVTAGNASLYQYQDPYQLLLTVQRMPRLPR